MSHETITRLTAEKANIFISNTGFTVQVDGYTILEITCADVITNDTRDSDGDHGEQ